ncbi:MAG TPA: hypothetical protein PKN14_08185 [Bacteroidia bacterium]|nr:MAG: hypothetical protein UZ10_BCD003002440 [Bacteroidetes bacterium OLB10]MBE7511010.1 hypothetical protein [Bacteroidia bacterium]MBX3106145.1 hypothetical protein [Bacteroidota bacterium]MCE7954770.1 hypothetical protein [Bacteroidetes bacterium CHB6]OQB62436.1 MAG: hypothetical protein BWX95_01390 [Bacteroidetes bacterium ADurb.Bin141]
MSYKQVIIPERFLNYLYHAFKNINNPEYHRVKLITRDGNKYRNLQVINGCVLLVERSAPVTSNDIEILQIDMEFIPVKVR